MATLQENISPTNQAQTTLDEDLKLIRDAKYDPVLEAEVCNWVGSIVGESKPENESAASWMKSGDILCQLMNAIRPGTIKKYNANTKSKFKQMENITLFLRSCREVGMLEKDLFSTIDLYESKDMNAVILSLFNLGGTIQSTIPYFTGPKIGIKQTNRNFAVVPQLQKPATKLLTPKPAPVVAPLRAATPVTSPKPSPPPPVSKLLLADITPSTLIERPASPPQSKPIPEVPAEEPLAPVAFEPVERAAAPPISMAQLRRMVPPVQAEPEIKATVASLKPEKTVAEVVEMDIKPRRRCPLNSNSNRHPIHFSSTAAAPQNHILLPPPAMTAPQVMVMHPAAMGTYQSYGSNLLKQVSANYGMRRKHVIIMPQDQSHQAVERATLEWIERVLNEAKPAVLTLHQYFASGEILCRLANAILAVSPNPNIRISVIARSVDPPKHQLDNAQKFTDICRALGVSACDTFAPIELFEGRDLRKVINCVFCLGGILQNYEWWVNCPTAPQLGKRLRIQNLVKV